MVKSSGEAEKRIMETGGQGMGVGHESLERLLGTAQALIENGRLDQAREILAQAAKNLDEMAPLLRHLADLFETAGDSGNASRTVDAYFALTQPIMAEKPPEPEAMEFAFMSGVDEEPFPSETLAAIYLGQGHVGKAIHIIRQLLQQHPRNDALKGRLAELSRMGAALQGPASETVSVDADEDRPAGDTSDRKGQWAQYLERLHTAARRRREAVESIY